MKYPKECAKKALDVLEKNYFSSEEGASNAELLTLAAICIGVVTLQVKEYDDGITFQTVKDIISEPKPYRKK